MHYMGLVVADASMFRPFEVKIDVVIEAVQELRMTTA